MKPGAKLVSKQPPADPAHDVLRQERQPLDAVFTPKCVAVIGATERPGSVGRRVLWALLSSPFGGTVFPVSKDRQSVLGIKAYPNVAAVPEAGGSGRDRHPGRTVPGIISECVQAGVRAAIVISAGFREHGLRVRRSNSEIADRIRRVAQLRVIGPNCLGVMNPLTGLNCHLFATDRAAGQCGVHQPERRAVHGHSRLEPA